MANQRKNAARVDLGQLPRVEVAPQLYEWNLRVKTAEPTPGDEVPAPPVASPAVLHVVDPGNLGGATSTRDSTGAPAWPGRLAPVDVPPQTYEWNLRVKTAEPEVLPWPTVPVDEADPVVSPTSRPARRRLFKRS